MNIGFIFCTFVFVFTRDTFTERLGGETANDYNDRVIRKAASWYAAHLANCGDSPPKVVLLTNDKANQEKAKAEGIITYTGTK